MERALSVGQEALWFVNRMAPDSAAYHLVYAVGLHDRLDLPALGRAVRETAQRHDILRSTFTEIDGVPRRVVRDGGLLRLEVRDVGAVSEDELAALAQIEVVRPFRLPTDGPARLVLLRRAPDDAMLVFVCHHIALDGPSQVLVLQDLLDAYQALREGGTPGWAPLTAGYHDFVAAERRLLDSPRAAELAGYWREVCADAQTVLDLPVDRPRLGRPRLLGGTHVFQMPPDIVDELIPASRANRTTPARYLIGLFQVLLYRCSGQRDFLIGCAATSTMGLNRLGVAGHFVNAIPLRTRVGPDASFRDVFAETNGQLREGMARVDYPSALLPQELGLTRTSGTSGLFQVLTTTLTVGRQSPLLTLAAAGHGATADYAGLRLSGHDLPQQEGQFDLTLELVRDRTSVRCALKYDTDLFDPATIARLGGYYRQLIRAAHADAGRPVAEVPLLDADERARLLAFATGRSDLTAASYGGLK
ncbi:condensation domain-containing protein [Amycolatopsis sp. PS_44_ISF1]|uniref:condensation domain-containing protein n=1 Tax=Amycolatopsis sp. PS_44_ISF1 TaxID=2974917 RepID=UPI0028DFF0BF|nr:condensation domain-containing protein [Amycolatopsis sp. PS_44_ISF1]MDT8913885.1 condensation domain-containing protein [Amycolatopsis sp. PS_44_ISF1]